MEILCLVLNYRPASVVSHLYTCRFFPSVAPNKYLLHVSIFFSFCLAQVTLIKKLFRFILTVMWLFSVYMEHFHACPFTAKYNVHVIIDQLIFICTIVSNIELFKTKHIKHYNFYSPLRLSGDSGLNVFQGDHMRC